jgi:putative flippase GtrA
MTTSGRTAFWRSQLVAAMATAVDFGTLIFCVEVLGLWYGFGTVLGALFGAATSFWLGRVWSFKATEEQAHKQAVRYALVSAGSLILNFLGVVALTELAHFKYWVSKAVVSLLVGTLYNFMLHRFFVFKPVRPDASLNY